MKILIVNEVMVLTEALEMHLKQEIGGTELVGTTSIARFKEQHPSQLPDIILMIIRSGTAAGRRFWIELDRAVRAYPESQLVICTDQPLPNVKKFLKKGISGYLSPNATLDELRLCIGIVSKRRKFIETDVLARLIGFDGTEDFTGNKMQWSLLSELEQTVAELLADQNTYREIAGIVNRSSRTIGEIKKRVFEKLNVENVSGLKQLISQLSD